MERLVSISLMSLQSFVDNPESITTKDISFQIAVASYPDTPRNLLEILANSDKPEVAEAARMHVNYAGELSENWQDVVDEKLKNRYLGQNDRLAVELLKIAPVPAYFLSEYVPSEYLIRGLSNPHLPLRYRLQLLTRLAQEPSLEPRLQVAESPDTPLPVLEQLIGDSELAIRIAVQYNPHCPPELVKLVTGQHEVASNWDTDTQQLENLSNSNWDWIRLAVAQNTSTSEETLLKLAGDKVFKIQLAVAKNPVTSANVLAVLAQHSNQEIQAEVAKHPKATEDILHNLFDLQQGVIKSRDNLPASILERIFNNKITNVPVWKNSDIKYFLLKQTNTPTWILAEFANIDIEKLTAEKLEQEQRGGSTPGIHQKWVSDEIKFLVDIAKHPQVSGEILKKLAQYPNFEVQLAVAQNNKTTEELRLRLLSNLVTNSSDRIERIKIKIAEDCNTPISILEQIGEDISSISKTIATLNQFVPNISSSLLDKIIDFLNRHQSPEQILFWLRQDTAFRESILQDWNELINSLDESQNQQLIAISSMMLPAIGLSGGVPNQDGIWLSHGLANAKIDPTNFLQNLPPTYSLYGLLMLVGMSYENDLSSQGIVAALLGNPTTPANLREQLWQRCKQEPDDMGRYFKDSKFRIALAYNTAIPDGERMNYFQQLLSGGNNEYIAKNPQTPILILEQLAENNRSKYGVAENPNASADLLRKLALENEPELLRRIANNPSTPTDVLIQLANRTVEQTINNVKPIRERVLNNTSLTNLQRYRLLIAQEEQKENDKANQILAKRTDSPYALARVLETGDQNIKISAARNPKTPIQVLEQLAKDRDETVRLVMAQNHNLPLNTLLELAEDSSVKVRLNLIYKSTHSKIKTPIELLEKLAKDESEQVRERVAEHPDTPEKLLVQLANDPSIKVKRKLTANLNTPVTVLNRLGLEENLVNQRNPNTPAMVLAQAATKMNSKALAEFIKHPVKGTQMPAETLADIASRQDASVRYRVAAHPNTPTKTLEKLARDSYIATVRAVASNPNTPPSALEYLANNSDLTTRLSIVRHSNTPDRVLRQIVENAQQSANAPNTTKDALKSGLFGDAYDLLIAIASNPRTPIDALEIIARREFVSPTSDPKSILPPRTDDDVIKSLVYNSNLTPQLLNILTQDLCVDVRVALTRHPNLTEELWIKLAEDKDISVRKAVATKTNVPVNSLETLSQDTETDIRVAVAENINTSTQVLEQLSQDTEATVRTKVAGNPNTPNNILETLANDKSVEVRRAVANNSNSSEAIKNSLKDLLPASKNNTQSLSSTLRGLSRIYNPNTDDLPTILSEYINSDVAFVRFVSLLHPLTPTEILEAAANSVSWLERYAVADNPNTLIEIKQQLTQDSNQIVRAVARENLTV